MTQDMRALGTSWQTPPKHLAERVWMIAWFVILLIILMLAIGVWG